MSSSSRFCISLAFGLAAVTTTALAANINGAIFTTVSTGTSVNANIYESKSDVYLSGGPQTMSDPGIDPDGTYYFQVTDPSGAVLLSTDDITCRAVIVKGGRIVGVPGDQAGGFGNPGCYHAVGTFNAANGTLPVQLLPYNDTPNPGGEYKAWLTRVEDYGVTCGPSHQSHGFCDSYSKTDNFKVRNATSSTVTVCKFNDINANGRRDLDEPMIPHWPIAATGVDAGPVQAQTGDDGCVAFSVVDFGATGAATVTLREGTVGPDWTQTAPIDCGATTDCAIDNGVITLRVAPGASIAAPDFGNTNPFCANGCSTDTPVVSATASSSYRTAYRWSIAKTVDQTSIRSAAAAGTFTFAVTVQHDAGVASEWKTVGQIRVSNPGVTAMSDALVSVSTTGPGTCSIGGGHTVSVPAGSHVDMPYACAFEAQPDGATISAAIVWNARTQTASADADFAHATVVRQDDAVTVTDSATGALGTVSIDAANPTTFTYTAAIGAAAGDCATYTNVATAVTNSSITSVSDHKDVRFCRGADLTASLTATPSFASAITKTASKTIVQQQGGSTSVTYSVTVTTSGWQTTGSVHVTNPNVWESVDAIVAVTSPGGVCGGPSSVTVPASGASDVAFTCAFTAAPATGVVTATVTWDRAAAFTPNGTVSPSQPFAFSPLTITDTFDGTTTKLGTISSTTPSTVYSYTKTLANALGGACRDYANIAAIVETDRAASRTVTMCNTLTFGRTMGFWQNRNGQALITAAPASITVWLRLLAPFQDLSATATPKTVASYTTTVIKAASASGASMNAMLKGQMLATALSVFFTDASLGGNALGARTPLGAVKLDVASACKTATDCTTRADARTAFGGASSLTAAQVLAFQNSVSNSGGSLWYGNNKTLQELAKNLFDAINNEVALLAK